MTINDETLRLARKMRITIGAEVDATVRELVGAWARSWDEIHDVWAAAMIDLAQASRDGAWPSLSVVARSEKATRALAAATAQIVDLSNFTGVTITDRLGNILTATTEAQARLIASQMPTQAGTTAELIGRFNRVDELALARIGDRSAQQIHASTYRLAYAAQETMKRVLVAGVAVGDNPRKAAREMIRRAEGGFNGGLTRALTIARTEMLDAHREAARGVDVANADLVTGWTWAATLDTRTCPSCWAMHGTVHDIEEQGPNDHQQGRCARIPNVKSWADMGFPNIAEPPSLLPDAQTTFDALAQADRLKIMGPARLQGLDDGTLTLTDLATRRQTVGWRDSWVPTPLRNLPAAS